MYVELSAPHHRPHFHAYYQDAVAVYSVDPIELIGGSLNRRQQRLVEAGAELHFDPATLQDWPQQQAEFVELVGNWKDAPPLGRTGHA
ncbi:MAG: DUF4160 domain-containing protein [Candidatus Hydrogenedentes bacterium]|nr:DUF4160 domain-containing protein [Candidatus Hydrogenedentota bacterium]